MESENKNVNDAHAVHLSLAEYLAVVMVIQS
jgi:hypothetical protein